MWTRAIFTSFAERRDIESASGRPFPHRRRCGPERTLPKQEAAAPQRRESQPRRWRATRDRRARALLLDPAWHARLRATRDEPLDHERRRQPRRGRPSRARREAAAPQSCANAALTRRARDPDATCARLLDPDDARAPPNERLEPPRGISVESCAWAQR